MVLLYHYFLKYMVLNMGRDTWYHICGTKYGAKYDTGYDTIFKILYHIRCVCGPYLVLYLCLHMWSILGTILGITFGIAFRIESIISEASWPTYWRGHGVDVPTAEHGLISLLPMPGQYPRDPAPFLVVTASTGEQHVATSVQYCCCHSIPASDAKMSHKVTPK